MFLNKWNFKSVFNVYKKNEKYIFIISQIIYASTYLNMGIIYYNI